MAVLQKFKNFFEIARDEALSVTLISINLKIFLCHF